MIDPDAREGAAGRAPGTESPGWGITGRTPRGRAVSGEVRLRRALFVWGPDGWNLMEEDKKGELVPKPFDRRRLEAEFGWNAGGFEIAEEANRRFSEAAIAPLAARLKRLSANGATGSSSSPKRRTKAGTPKPSASSSPTPSAASTAPTP